MPLSLLVIDDHRVFTDTLALSLDLEPDLCCVATAQTAREGLAKAAAIEVDVAIVDLDLPDASGIEVVAELLALRPALRAIVLTAHPRADLAARALLAGAAAFLPKDAALRSILSAVRTADPAHPVVDAPRQPAIALTAREYDVLRQLAQGLDAHRCATALGLSVYTTRDHIKALMGKLSAHTQLEAVVAADRLGLISVGSRY
ncbi:LuxR family two component transcriptional regulator [Asanoa ferruginea]|uniref:LuxR family two component transcriptional regulator n=1 Tax=Asanoa ferruginea TaxID=53367 RepID=A0A3D9ZZF7_9ACTN|nr:response regulator transcription factor [Asanoa ferruginea]REF99250.1 LuxR family two component transcriptional regulator [Asanoa ferruginea]GIF45848.1 DNA-binding response regulator [Asanoa ferruginea]